MSTKDRIMETTFKLLLKKGFANVSLSDIIKAADITTGGFYYHFDSKETLMVAAIKRYIYDHYYFLMEKIKNSEAPPDEKLKMALSSRWKYNEVFDKPTQIDEIFPEKPDYRVVHLLLMEGMQKYEAIGEHFREFHHDLAITIKELVDEGVAQGTVRSDISSTEIAALIQTSIVGIIIMWLAIPGIPIDKRSNCTMGHVWSYIAK